MNLETTQYYKEPFQDERMLFVRTDGIFETMAKVPLIIAGLLVFTIMIPIQTSFSSTRTLELVIYSDGSTHISSQIEVNPLNPDYELTLFGPSIDNFMAIGENDFLLTSEIMENKAMIDTFGSSSIIVDYDTHDLISKEGRVWTFSFDSELDYSLRMPENSVIVGMSTLPNNMEVIDATTRLDLPSGHAEINYIFNTPTIPSNPTNPLPSVDYTILAMIIGPIIAGIISILFIKKKQSKSIQPNIKTEIISEKPQENKVLDPEIIFNTIPDMREDDKEIIKFISENGGKVLESDLRKKFLQPRTTMWRAVKRLERLGVVEISKKDLQNMVKLKEKLEERE